MCSINSAALVFVGHYLRSQKRRKNNRSMALMKGKTLFSILFFVLLLIASEVRVGVEARKCHYHVASRRFHGLCFSHGNCATVCRTEGYSTGDCKGFRRRCMCRGFC